MLNYRDKEYLRALNLYSETFGDCFPTIPLAWSRKREEIIEMINNCIKQKKDVRQLGYYKEPEEEGFY